MPSSRFDLPSAAGVLAVAGATVALMVSSPQLTGWPWVDTVWYLLAGVGVPMLCRRSSWSAVVLAAVALLTTRSGAPLIGGVIVAVVLLAGAVRATTPVVRVVGGAGLLALTATGGWHHSSWSTGWLMAAAVVALVVDVATGPRSADTWERRAARRTAVVGGVLLAFAAVSAGPALAKAGEMRRSLGQAVDSARSGDVEVATAELSSTADRCGSIRAATSGVRAVPLRIVPGLGRQVRRTARFSAACTRDLRMLATTITEVRAGLTPVEGRYDVAALARVPEQLAQARATLADLTGRARRYLRYLPIPHPPGGILDRLADIDRAQLKLASVEPLARQLPALFGDGGPRRYFVMFLTPSEGRPLGGFMGNWALVRADGGRVEIERSGRAADLNAVNYGQKRLNGLEEFRTRYEGALSGGVDSLMDPEIWFLYTITPDFPTASEVARQLAPQSGIGEIDGVIGIDIDALTDLIALTGPIDLAEFGLTVTAESARQLFLVDQYEALPSREDRVPFLQAVGDELGRRLTGGAVGLTKLASTVRDDIDRGGVGVWFVRPDEQQAAISAGLAPSFPRPEGHDGFIVTTQNRSPNKLDAFLSRRIDYVATVDLATGAVSATGTVTLTNHFDPADHPGYAEAGNLVDDPPNSLRNVVCVYTPYSFVDASVPLFDRSQLGWNEGCAELVMEPGQSQTFSASFEGSADFRNGYCFVSRGQVTAVPDEFHVVVTTTDGATLLDVRLDGAKVKWLAGSGCPPN